MSARMATTRNAPHFGRWTVVLVACLLMHSVGLPAGAGMLRRPVVRVAQEPPRLRALAPPAIDAEGPQAPQTTVPGSAAAQHAAPLPGNAFPSEAFSADGPSGGGAESLPPGSRQPLPPGGDPSGELGSIKPITEIAVLSAPPAGELPTNLAATGLSEAAVMFDPSQSGRPWSEQSFLWAASAYYHRPLYFEEPNLERYGLKHGCVQPAVSAAHFFLLVPAMPYLALVDRPMKRVYDLGYRRPGEPALRVPHRYRFRPLAAAAEAALIVGLVVLIP